MAGMEEGGSEEGKAKGEGRREESDDRLQAYRIEKHWHIEAGRDGNIDASIAAIASSRQH
jgi:hypothetical protein